MEPEGSTVHEGNLGPVLQRKETDTDKDYTPLELEEKPEMPDVGSLGKRPLDEMSDLEIERQQALETSLRAASQSSDRATTQRSEVDTLLTSMGFNPNELGVGELNDLLERPSIGTIIKSIFGGIASFIKSMFRRKPKEEAEVE